jgi:hypothetical protein
MDLRKLLAGLGLSLVAAGPSSSAAVTLDVYVDVINATKQQPEGTLRDMASVTLMFTNNALIWTYFVHGRTFGVCLPTTSLSGPEANQYGVQLQNALASLAVTHPHRLKDHIGLVAAGVAMALWPCSAKSTTRP